MEKDIVLTGILDMKELHGKKKTFWIIHRYAYYANNNIFDAPNAISQNTP